jgi:hypothetical protein
VSAGGSVSESMVRTVRGDTPRSSSSSSSSSRSARSGCYHCRHVRRAFRQIPSCTGSSGSVPFTHIAVLWCAVLCRALPWCDTRHRVVCLVRCGSACCSHRSTLKWSCGRCCCSQRWVGISAGCFCVFVGWVGR